MIVSPRADYMLRAGSEVRFQVRNGESGNGSTWKIWTTANTGDVYVLHRDAARWIKASFHESGQWHYSVTNAGLTLHEGEQERLLFVTTEHPEISVGWNRAKRITVARAELRHWAEPEPVGGLLRVPVPFGYEAVMIELLLGRSDALPIRVDDRTRVVAGLRRGDGGVAVLLRTPVVLSAPVHTFYRDEIAAATSDMMTLGWDGTRTRSALFTHDDDLGAQRDIEFAVDAALPSYDEDTPVPDWRRTRREAD